jgi:hypothetical protein
VQQKLPRAFAGEARGALGGEPIVAGAIVQADPAKPALTVVLVTETRLLHVDKKETRSWPLTEVAVTDYQQQATAQLAALAVLAGDELLRFLIPRGEQAQDLHAVFRQLRALNNDEVVGRVSELPWWERKAAWPYAALGRVAGGTTALIQGQHGSIGLGRRGVSIYLGNSAVPSLQMPWQDVTEVLVEPPAQLKARVSAEQLLLLGVLAWGLETTEGETFVTVTTKNQDLYFAVQAPVTELRGFWGSVLSHFAVDSDEVAVPAATIKLPAAEGDLVSRLERLAALHATGALSAEEYASAKAAVIQGR